jgi:hypothetical protein
MPDAAPVTIATLPSNFINENPLNFIEQLYNKIIIPATKQ